MTKIMKIRKRTKKNRKYHGNLNNCGMSLVEVVIAMAILSIVVVAVVQSLTMAMVYNKKARAKQDVTIKAESIMEIFKGYNVDELFTMFQGEPHDGGTAGRMIGSGYYDVAKDGVSGKLTFSIDNLIVNSTETGAGEKYNVEIVATPVKELSLFETQKLDKTRDAVFTGKEKYDEQARDHAYTDITVDRIADFVDYLNNLTDEAGNPIPVCDVNDAAFTADTVEIEMDDIFLSERKTVFTINDGSVEAKMTYQYRIYGFEYYWKVPAKGPSDPSDPDTYDEEEEHSEAPSSSEPAMVRDDTPRYLTYPVETEPALEFEVTLDSDAIQFSGSQVERLLIYYYPQYEKKTLRLPDGTIRSDAKIKDKIEIVDARSDTSQNIDCFVIKQRRASMSDALLSLRDPDQGFLPDISYSATVNLYQNLNENILNGEKIWSDDALPVSVGKNYMDVADKEKNVLAYALELTVTKSETGNVVTKLVSSTNEN